MIWFSNSLRIVDALGSGGAVVPLLLCVALCELFWPEHKSAVPFVRRWTGNFSVFAISVALMSVLAPGFAFITNSILNQSPLSWAPATIGFWFHLTVACLALDALNYAVHWGLHKVPMLWRLHALHHTDIALDVSTTVRHHPLETVVTALMVGVGGALLGCSAVEVAVYGVLETFIQLVAHADVRLPRLLEQASSGIFVTPEFHRIHHSSRTVETDSNYGQVFAFWDRLFGTYGGTADDVRGAIEFGLREFRDDRSQRLDQLLLLPLYAIRAD